MRITKREMPAFLVFLFSWVFLDNLAAGCIVRALSRAHPLNAIRLSRAPGSHPNQACDGMSAPMQPNDLELKEGDSHSTGRQLWLQ